MVVVDRGVTRIFTESTVLGSETREVDQIFALMTSREKK